MTGGISDFRDFVRHLSYSQIREISDEDLLNDIREQLDFDVQHIEVMLEFPPEYEDDNWEKRTKYALANKRALRQSVIRKLNGSSRQDQRVQQQQSIIQKLEATIAEMKAKSDKSTINAETQAKIAAASVEKAKIKWSAQSSRDYFYSMLAREYLTREQAVMCGQRAEAMAQAAALGLNIQEMKNDAV